MWGCRYKGGGSEKQEALSKPSFFLNIRLLLIFRIASHVQDIWILFDSYFSP